MTFAPEDQNGLREALARWLREWADRPGTLADGNTLADALIAGPLASLIAERDEKCERLWGLWMAARDRAFAAEAEITRLKEGMEAAPSEAQIAMGAAACIDVWCGGKSWRTAESDGPSQEFMAGADWEMAVTLTKAVLATLSPKEQPHG